MGYVPRLSAVIAQMAGSQADSRAIIQEFCASVLGFPISPGAIQKIIDRASAAIEHHYERIGSVARTGAVNHIDETSFVKKGKRNINAGDCDPSGRGAGLTAGSTSITRIEMVSLSLLRTISKRRSS